MLLFSMDHTHCASIESLPSVQVNCGTWVFFLRESFAVIKCLICNNIHENRVEGISSSTLDTDCAHRSEWTEKLNKTGFSIIKTFEESLTRRKSQCIYMHIQNHVNISISLVFNAVGELLEIASLFIACNCKRMTFVFRQIHSSCTLFLRVIHSHSPFRANGFRKQIQLCEDENRLNEKWYWFGAHFCFARCHIINHFSRFS